MSRSPVEEPPATEAGRSDGTPVDQAFAVVYAELRALARRQLRRERPGHTLDSVALVHEAYLRLRDSDQVRWAGEAHFLAVAVRAMRHVLVDHARARATEKRGAAPVALPLEAADETASIENAEHLLAVDDALARLAAADPDAARVVEYRYFAGLALPEIAAALGMSVATVRRRWSFAKAWLQRDLRG